MSTSLHGIFHVIFSNVYVIIVISNIHDKKMRFSESSQNSLSENSIFGHFQVSHFSQRIIFFQGKRGFFLLVNSKKSV